MKLICVLISLILPLNFAHSDDEVKTTPIEIRSSEGIAFYSKKDMTFSDIGKTASYAGVIMRTSEPSAELNSIDLYRFPNETQIKITKSLCKKYAHKIFGDLKNRDLKLTGKFELFETPVGKTCAFKVKDSFEKAVRPFKFTHIGFVHGRLIALVWDLSKDPNAETLASFENFWKSLK